MQKEPMWFRIAGNSQQMSIGGIYPWRGFYNKEGEAVPLKTWQLIGNAHADNYIPGVRKPNQELDLLAWIDIYGVVTINGGVATILLK